MQREEKYTEKMLTLVILFLHRFYLENFFLDEYVRYDLIIYPVVVVALTGSAWKNFSFSSPTTNGIFIGESFGLFLTLVDAYWPSFAAFLCIRGRKTDFSQSIICKNRTRDYLEFINLAKQKAEQKSLPVSLGLDSNLVLPEGHFLVQYVCSTIFHLPLASSAGSST